MNKSPNITREDIIDFYLLATLPFPSDPANIFIWNEIADRVKHHVLSECESVVLREYRHGMNIPTKLKEILMKRFNDRYMKGVRLMTVAELEKMAETVVNLEEIAKDFKDKSSFDGPLGGECWARITRHLIKIRDASNSIDIKTFFHVFDRFFDFIHNTDNIAASFRGGVEGWLRPFLTFKQHSQSVFELIAFASKELRKILGDPEIRVFLIRFLGYETREKWFVTVVKCCADNALPARGNFLSEIYGKIASRNLFLLNRNKLEDMDLSCLLLRRKSLAMKDFQIYLTKLADL